MRFRGDANILGKRECVKRTWTMYELREFVKGIGRPTNHRGLRGVDNDPYILIGWYHGRSAYMRGM